ncbi:hypothetical protein AB0D54_23140 [Streptomyces xanthophaeus]|uniref:hypothetical protein n=1 Tax=Streptomyces xanthophaeus TaxID=67385 RepID=UPI003415E062
MTDDDPDIEVVPAVRAAKRLFAEQLLANPDVHGVGVGRRRRVGEKTDEYAIVVHVEHKLPSDRVAPHRLVPEELSYPGPDGRPVVVRVDVQERARPHPEAGPAPVASALRSKVRPVPGGVSAGRSGTLGGWVWDTVTGQVVALSNRHIFGSVPGTSVAQPSRDDGGRPATDRIAAVVRAGNLDAAIAAPLDPHAVSLSIVGGGQAVFAITDAAIDMRVQKTGRTTGLTRGVVDLIDYDSDHHGSHSDLWIDGDGTDFSGGGDSGALYLESGNPGADASDARRVVGLHWGGAGNDGVGHHIRAVFADLGLAPLND